MTAAAAATMTTTTTMTATTMQPRFSDTPLIPQDFEMDGAALFQSSLKKIGSCDGKKQLLDVP